MQSLRGFRPGVCPALAVAVLLLLPAAVQAEEDLFGHVQNVETEPPGEWELTQWATLRAGKQAGTFRALDLRTELETGLTDRLQAALYLDVAAHRIRSVPGLEDRNELRLQGGAAELEYRLRDVSPHGFGLALYAEARGSRIADTSGDAERVVELETKLILERHLFDDRLVWTVNYTLEPEWSVGHVRPEHAEGEDSEREARRELGEELAMGLSARLDAHWSLGAELRAASSWEDFSRRESTALFLGPDLHYQGDDWWWTLAVTPQVWGSPADAVPGLDLADRERLELRVKLGVEL